MSVGGVGGGTRAFDGPDAEAASTSAAPAREADGASPAHRKQNLIERAVDAFWDWFAGFITALPSLRELV